MEFDLARPFVDIVVAGVGACAVIVAAWLHARRTPPSSPIRVDAGPGLVDVADKIEAATDELRWRIELLESSRKESDELRGRVAAIEHFQKRIEHRLEDLFDKTREVRHLIVNQETGAALLRRYNVTPAEIREILEERREVNRIEQEKKR